MVASGGVGWSVPIAANLGKLLLPNHVKWNDYKSLSGTISQFIGLDFLPIFQWSAAAGTRLTTGSCSCPRLSRTVQWRTPNLDR